MLSITFACNRNGGSNEADSLSNIQFNGNLPVDFTQFYMQFHIDSTYQIEHIIFPLTGLPPNADSIQMSKTYQWEAENWRMHRPFKAASGYDQEYISIDDKTITEYIIDPQTGFGMERRFSKLKNKWYLIYYSAMNKISEGG